MKTVFVRLLKKGIAFAVIHSAVARSSKPGLALGRKRTIVRSKLFVPGSRPELFEKALQSAADAVTFDLEDAVVAEKKAEARDNVARLLHEQHKGWPLVIVRVNPLSSAHFEADLAALVRPGLDVLNLPKVENAAEIVATAEKLARMERDRGIGRQIGILANIETPRGVRLAAEIACAHRRIVGLQLGFGDLFEPFGIDRSDLAAATALRLTVRLAAAEGNVPLYDSAFPAVEDAAAFRAEAEAARRLGLAGKSCIHPSQIAVANEVFFPTDKERAAASAIVTAAEQKFAAGIGAFMMDGIMIDEPYVARARAILEIGSERSGRS